MDGIILRKTIFEVADGVFGKKVRSTAKSIIETSLFFINRRMGIYKNYLSDRS